MEMDVVRGAGAVAGTRGRYPGTQALRTLGSRSFRSRKAMVRSRRRYPRSDRLLHLLRPANAATRTPQAYATGAGRRKLLSLLAAWRRLRNCAVELSDRDSLRHGVGRSCCGKCRDHRSEEHTSE